MKRSDNPCYECGTRFRACHDVCSKYQDWRNEREARRHKERARKEINNLIRDNELKRFKDIKMGHKGKGLARKKAGK